MTSCSADEPMLPEQQVNLSVSVNVDCDEMTRAGGNLDSAKGGVGNLGSAGLNYIFALYEVDADGSLSLTELSQVTDDEGDGERFSPVVILGKTYKIVAYAHFGDAKTITDTDKATFLENIELSSVINEESEDVYFGSIVKKFTNDNLEQLLTISRPYAKLRIVATDWDSLLGEINSVEVNYGLNTIFNKFNALTGEFYNVTTLPTLSSDVYSASDLPTEKTILADYLPVNISGVTLSDFTVTVKYNNSTLTIARTFNSVPLQRNSVTTLKGAFFTSSMPLRASFGEWNIGL